MKCRVKSVPKGNFGLQIEDNQFKHISPSMIEIKGNSHENGGTMLNYMGKTVEAEAGEPLTIDNNGDAIIYGNLEIPGSKKKFKTVAKELGKQEAKASKLQDKASLLIGESNPFNPYSSLKYNAGRVMQDAATQKNLSIQEQKQELADLQQFMLNLADATGESPEKISSTFKNGGKLKPKYKDGGDVEAQSLVALRKALAKQESSGNYTAQPIDPKTGKPVSSAYGKYQFIEGTRKSYYNKYFKDKYPTFGAFDLAYKESPELQEDVMSLHLRDLSKKYDGDPMYIALAHRLGEKAASDIKNKGYYVDTKGRKIDLNTPIGSSQKPTDRETPGQYLEKLGITTPIPNSPQQIVNIPSFAPDPNEIPDLQRLYPQPVPFSNVNINPNNSGVFSQDELVISNYSPHSTPVRKQGISATELNKLQPYDFATEIPAILDRADYVQGQRYEPNLYQPFQVSFQDRLNQNNSTFRQMAQQIPNNPQALSVLAAQKYNADNQVLGEQFRTNQQIANEVTNQNTGLLNQAALQNLQLQDQQYVRQEQAKAITQARRDQALASVANKFGKKRQTDTNIRLAESLSDYRFDEQGNIIYAGDPTKFAAGVNSSMSGLSSKQLKLLADQRKLEEDQIKAVQIPAKKWGGYLNKKK